MATAMAMGNCDGNGNGNGNGVGDSNGNGDDDGNGNGEGHGEGNHYKGRVAFSCGGDVLRFWRGDTLPPPPWTQRKGLTKCTANRFVGSLFSDVFLVILAK